MLRRLFTKGLLRLPYKFLASCLRNFKVDSNPRIPGGGLGKLQGSIDEETYFNKQDQELIEKIRHQDEPTLKCEKELANWGEFEKILKPSVKLPAAHRDTCCMNKHKNYREEAFFLSQHFEAVATLQKKFEVDEFSKIPKARNKMFQDSASNVKTDEN